ncbi:MAG: DUF2752 domain-containing protein [Tannerella sp.]|jgi:hypothetical protein|nr:DUF2752 domain-containing protein [Tannerella sp.]
MLISVSDWLKEHLLTCPSKHFFHLDCPGCGLQRSIVALFEGNLTESIRLYPATIPMMATFLFAFLHLKYDFKHGAAVIKYLFILNVTIIIAFYLYKIFTHKLI